MESDVTLDDFCHEGIHSTSASRDVVKDVGALCLLVQRFLDSRELSLNAMDAVQQSFFLFGCMCHQKLTNNRKKTSQVYPGGYTLRLGKEALRAATLHQKGGPFDV
jgi:hypothetical protein